MPSPLDTDLTRCLSQLGDRAEELGEKNTAVVLKSLVAHRLMVVDYVMAVVASEQAATLMALITSLKKKEGDTSL